MPRGTSAVFDDSGEGTVPRGGYAVYAVAGLVKLSHPWQSRHWLIPRLSAVSGLVVGQRCWSMIVVAGLLVHDCCSRIVGTWLLLEDYC